MPYHFYFQQRKLNDTNTFHNALKWLNPICAIIFAIVNHEFVYKEMLFLSNGVLNADGACKSWLSVKLKDIRRGNKENLWHQKEAGTYAAAAYVTVPHHRAFQT